MRTGSCIDGEWYHPRGERAIRNVNPADTSDVIAEFPSATAADARRASTPRRPPSRLARHPAARARTGALAGGRHRAPAADEIARTMTREEGKILREARGEVTKGITLLEFYAGEGFRMGGKTAALRGARHLHLHHPPAAGRGRPHHALELPVGDPGAGSRRPRWSPATPSSSSPRS